MTGRQLVIGLGEVGGPLREVLGVDGIDPKLGTNVPSPGLFDVLHIAYPWQVGFCQTVDEYRAQYGHDGSLIIIHSTVPIGTTRSLGRAVHSPVNGRRDTMAEDLRRLPKWVGGPWAQEAADLLLAAGFDPIVYPRSEQTEAMKLLCLAQYGVDNAFARYREKVAKAAGLEFEDIKAWLDVYNDNVEPHLRRPIIEPDGYRIGGHCVVPGAALLHRDHPSPLTVAVMAHR